MTQNRSPTMPAKRDPVRVDAATLGIPAHAKARDFESGEAIDGDAANGFAFEMKKHDFKALVIE